ncbi:MAG: hypothetical protein ABL925_13985, partial [Methylococcales bacterium]
AQSASAADKQCASLRSAHPTFSAPYRVNIISFYLEFLAYAGMNGITLSIAVFAGFGVRYIANTSYLAIQNIRISL